MIDVTLIAKSDDGRNDEVKVTFSRDDLYIIWHDLLFDVARADPNSTINRVKNDI